MSETDELFDGVVDDLLPDEGRRALVSLLTNRYVTRSRNVSAWKGLVDFESQIRARLADLYLSLELDLERGVAFKRQVDIEDGPRLLRREKQELSRDASLLLLHLVQECALSTSASDTVVTTEQVGEFLRTFRSDRDNDERGFERRVSAAINALVKPWNLLVPDPVLENTFTVSPVVPVLLGVDEITRLEGIYRAAVQSPDDDEAQP